MNKIAASDQSAAISASAAILASAVILAFMTVGSAQAGKPSPAGKTQPAPGASQTARAPYSPPGPDQGVGQSRPLFVVGGVPVVLWAPVQPPYNSRMNRPAAAGQWWDSEAF